MVPHFTVNLLQSKDLLKISPCFAGTVQARRCCGIFRDVSLGGASVRRGQRTPWASPARGAARADRQAAGRLLPRLPVIEARLSAIDDAVVWLAVSSDVISAELVEFCCDWSGAVGW